MVRAPSRILATQLADQFANVTRNARPPALAASSFACPEQTDLASAHDRRRIPAGTIFRITGDFLIDRRLRAIS